uniref:Ig-like domain-containing protein n=1 Tax=Sinocyclocheilus rhinocerous TaxID=307959 RepID=A0A673G7U3_9TELE
DLYSAQPGQEVKLNCKANRPVHLNDHLAWYFREPGGATKLLIHRATIRFTGTPSRFTGSGHGADFTLTISGVRPEDAGHYFYYYCQQHYELPRTQAAGTKAMVLSLWLFN